MELTSPIFLPLLLVCAFCTYRKSLAHEGLEKRTVAALVQDRPGKDRIWNFMKGEFELIEPGNIRETRIEPSQPPILKKRKKRASSKLSRTKMLELAVYVDQALWDNYVDKYGFRDAEERIRTFAGIMLNTTRSLYQNPSLSPRLEINIEKFEIWKKQPRALRNINADGLRYVDEFCSYVRPRSSGFDHATLISGQKLTVGLDIDGIAWQDSVCTDNSCTVVRGAFNTAYRHGNTLAHEMGHSLGMVHDGSGASRGCDADCCVMAPKNTGTRWSSCSRNQYRGMLLARNCMDDTLPSRYFTDLLTSPISYLPGQAFPDEAQCHQIVGTCFRSVPGHEGDCSRHYCTRHQDSSIMTTVSEFRLDGSYCGSGKVCDGGQCIRLDASRRRQLRAISGGWSQWSSETERNCGDGECSDCRIKSQVSVHVEVRRCDDPYPNNGGRPCQGSQIRGVSCSQHQQPWRCRSRRATFSSKNDYMHFKCQKAFPERMTSGTRVMFRKDDSGCDFVCFNSFLVEDSPVRFPDGTSCGSNRSGGRCVHGVCMFPKCARHPNYFVISQSDCPL